MSDFEGMRTQGWPANLSAQKVTILSGASVTEMIPTQGRALVGVLLPASWTAAGLGFKISLDGNPSSLKFVETNGGSAMTTGTLTADKFVAFPALDALFGPFLQLVSVTTNTYTPVAQGGDRELILIFRNLFD